MNDQSGGAAGLELFRFLVLNVSGVTGIQVGVWWFEYQQWQ